VADLKLFIAQGRKSLPCFTASAETPHGHENFNGHVKTYAECIDKKKKNPIRPQDSTSIHV
jgi:hypothetical protein